MWLENLTADGDATVRAWFVNENGSHRSSSYFPPLKRVRDTVTLFGLFDRQTGRPIQDKVGPPAGFRSEIRDDSLVVTRFLTAVAQGRLTAREADESAGMARGKRWKKTSEAIKAEAREGASFYALLLAEQGRKARPPQNKPREAQVPNRSEPSLFGQDLFATEHVRTMA